jgi:hypothetical protein
MRGAEGFVRRDQFVNKLRELGFRFKSQHDRIDWWRRPSDGKEVPVRRRDLLPVAAVVSQLRQVGVREDEIRGFVEAARG